MRVRHGIGDLREQFHGLLPASAVAVDIDAPSLDVLDGEGLAVDHGQRRRDAQRRMGQSESSAREMARPTARFRRRVATFGATGRLMRPSVRSTTTPAPMPPLQRAQRYVIFPRRRHRRRSRSTREACPELVGSADRCARTRGGWLQAVDAAPSCSRRGCVNRLPGFVAAIQCSTWPHRSDFLHGPTTTICRPVVVDNEVPWITEHAAGATTERVRRSERAFCESRRAWMRDRGQRQISIHHPDNASRPPGPRTSCCATPRCFVNLRTSSRAAASPISEVRRHVHYIAASLGELAARSQR